MNVAQFDKLVCRPTLEALSPELPFSEVAHLLVLETIIHESDGLQYLEQLGGGPGLGLLQMEWSTFDWLAYDWLMRNPRVRTKICMVCSTPYLDHNDLVWNLRLNVAFCRLRYFVHPSALPQLDEGVEARAAYWGRVYQTTDDPVKNAQYVEHAGRYLA